MVSEQKGAAFTENKKTENNTMQLKDEMEDQNESSMDEEAGAQGSKNSSGNKNHKSRLKAIHDQMFTNTSLPTDFSPPAKKNQGMHREGKQGVTRALFSDKTTMDQAKTHHTTNPEGISKDHTTFEKVEH